MSNHVKIVINDMMLTREVSDMDLLLQSAISVISTPDSQRQENQVINNQSDSIEKTVIRYQYEFATTQLGLKTLRKGAA